MRKVTCYIDGFNLYHAIHELRHPHLKWVNLYSLVNSYIYPDEQLISVNYFSAYATWLPDKYNRHRAYVDALEYVGVNCEMAHFKERMKRCRSCGTSWKDHEEKETDVRLALKILEDAVDNVFERAIIISADSDLVPVARTIRRRYPKKKILIATPPGRHAGSRDLRSVAHHSITITKGRIEKHLLPEKIIDGAGNVIAERHVSYNPPC